MQLRPLAVRLARLAGTTLRPRPTLAKALLLLYVAAGGAVTEPATAQEARPAESATPGASSGGAQDSQPPGASAAEPSQQPPGKPSQQATEAPPKQAPEKPHVALILPLKSASLGRLAEAVRLGVTAAAAADRSDALPLITYSTGDEAKELLSVFDRAAREGARLVIGPFSKAAVHVMARSGLITIPTLALTAPDADVPLPDNMYAFGLQLESEARQIARLAQQQGRRRAVIIATDSPLSKRVSQSFAEEWTRGARVVVDHFVFSGDLAQLRKIRDGISSGNTDMVFLALDSQRARQVRPYIPKALSIYATSQVHAPVNDVVGQHDLNGVTFVDMPWILMPDHPAVIAYARPQGLFSATDQDRFFALGIDAWRLGQSLLETGFSDAGTLDGVTGYIAPGQARQFRREAIAAQYSQGQPRLLNPVSGR